jgi:hypothetical protein
MCTRQPGIQFRTPENAVDDRPLEVVASGQRGSAGGKGMAGGRLRNTPVVLRNRIPMEKIGLGQRRDDRGDEGNRCGCSHVLRDSLVVGREVRVGVLRAVMILVIGGGVVGIGFAGPVMMPGIGGHNGHASGIFVGGQQMKLYPAGLRDEERGHRRTQPRLARSDFSDSAMQQSHAGGTLAWLEEDSNHRF